MTRPLHPLSECLLDDLRAAYDQGHMQPWHERLAAIEAAVRAEALVDALAHIAAEHYRVCRPYQPITVERLARALAATSPWTPFRERAVQVIAAMEEKP